MCLNGIDNADQPKKVAGATFTHIGWVPTIAGRLFFKRLDCSLAYKKKKLCISHIHKSDEGVRTKTALVHAKVDWQDFKVKGNNKKHLGLFQVSLFTSYKPSQPEIEGVVYIASHDAWKSTYKDIYSKIKEIEIEKEKETPSDLKTKIDELQALHHINRHPKLYEVRFLLDRYGFVKLAYCSRDEEYKDIHKLTVLRQAYYFIKYSWHKHKHHDNTAECLTTIHPLKETRSETGHLLLNDLKDSMVRLKQDYRPYRKQTMIHAQGIASYAKSLAQSLHSCKYFTNEELEQEKVFLNNMSESINVLDSKSEREKSHTVSISNSYKSLILFILAFVAPMIIILRDDIKKNVDQAVEIAGESASFMPVTVLKNLATHLLTNSTWTISAATLLVAMYIPYEIVFKRFGTLANSFSWLGSFVEVGAKNISLTNRICYFLVIALVLMIIYSTTI